jgi:hypothetical protein
LFDLRVDSIEVVAVAHTKSHPGIGAHAEPLL